MISQQKYDEITQWQDKTFLKATPLSCAKHLKEEVNELNKTLKNRNPDLLEIADCFLLLIGVCNKLGLTYQDIVLMLDEKMIINYQRKWIDSGNGYMKHKS